MVEQCRAGAYPALIARMTSGWAILGQKQVLRGYSLLLPDPVVPHLNALEGAARERFLIDLGRLGQAVQEATGALRINYAIFGNLEPALHAHVHPRYADEPEKLRCDNAWAYDWNAAPPFAAGEHAGLIAAIRTQLASRELAVPVPAGRLHHIDITVSCLARSTQFYARWLPRMGLRRIEDCDEGPLWRGDGWEFGLQQAREGVATRPHDRQSVGLHHLAFRAHSREDVLGLHEELLAANEAILDPPALYERYSPHYFALFFADPDGIKLEYVFTPG